MQTSQSCRPTRMHLLVVFGMFSILGIVVCAMGMRRVSDSSKCASLEFGTNSTKTCLHVVCSQCIDATFTCQPCVGNHTERVYCGSGCSCYDSTIGVYTCVGAPKVHRKHYEIYKAFLVISSILLGLMLWALYTTHLSRVLSMDR